MSYSGQIKRELCVYSLVWRRYVLSSGSNFDPQSFLWPLWLVVATTAIRSLDDPWHRSWFQFILDAAIHTDASKSVIHMQFSRCQQLPQGGAISTICGSQNEILTIYSKAVHNLLKSCAELVTTLHETGAVKCQIISRGKMNTASVTDINKANPMGSAPFATIVKSEYNHVLLFAWADW